MGSQGSAGSFSVSRNDVDYALGEARFHDQFAEQQCCEWSLFRRFQDHRVSGGVDVLFVTFSHLRQDFSRRGIVGWEGLTGNGSDPLAVNQHLARLADKVGDAGINLDWRNCCAHRSSCASVLRKCLKRRDSTLAMVIPGGAEGNRGKAGVYVGPSYPTCSQSIP